MSLNSVEEARQEERDGARYYVYEHISQVGGGYCIVLHDTAWYYMHGHILQVDGKNWKKLFG